MKYDYNKILEESFDAIMSLSAVVDDVGITIGLNLPQNHVNYRAGVHHDYVYYCVTKCLRSLCAMYELAKIGLNEDFMAISRSVYETYLLLSNVLRNPDFIDVVVFQELKLSIGAVKRINHKIVQNVETREILSHDLGKTTLSKNTLHKYDAKIHYYFYKYMSEIIHSNFLSSGNYRTNDNKKYVFINESRHLEVTIFIAYFVFLISEHIQYYHAKFRTFNEVDLRLDDSIELQYIELNSKKRIIEMLKGVEFPPALDSKLRNFLIRRITGPAIFT